MSTHEYFNSENKEHPKNPFGAGIFKNLKKFYMSKNKKSHIKYTINYDIE